MRPRLEPSGASEHVGGAAQHGCAGQQADEPTRYQGLEPDGPRLEPIGASEHVGDAARHGSAAQEADEPTQDQELEPDDASSRGSIDWNEGQRRDLPTAYEMPGGVARVDHHGATGFALAKSAALLPEFRTHVASHTCIGAAWIKPMNGVLQPGVPGQPQHVYGSVLPRAALVAVHTTQWG